MKDYIELMKMQGKKETVFGVLQYVKGVCSVLLISSLLVSIILCCTACNPDCTTLPVQCDLIPDSGPCFAAIEKYFFDSDDQMCKAFTWGGCEGTVPFDSLEECQVCECH